MSGFTLPKFAKTNGKTQKATEAGRDVESPSTRSPSFFKSLKSKLAQSHRSMGSKSFDEDNEPFEDKSYFTKTGGTTMAKNINAFAWGGHSSTLQECAAEGDIEGVKRLLNLGEDIDDVDQEGNTALHYAAEGGFQDVTKFLLERGADASSQNDDGDRPMHKATINNYVDIIALLVAGHADVNAQSNTGWTALHEAACNGRLEAAQTLLHVGADVNKRTKEGDTALHKAARWGRVEIVKLLMLVGADAHARDKLGREPLQRTNVEEIIQMLKIHKRAQACQDGSPSPRRQTQSSPSKSRRKTDHGSVADYDEEWDLADQRELYEVQWTLFASNKSPERKITYSDVPWPGMSTSPEDIVQVVLYGTTTAEEKKKRLRSELLRWHPDKFMALFGRDLKQEDADQIMAKVKEISQAINIASK